MPLSKWSRSAPLRRGSSHRAQARDEIMGLIGNLFGITPEQMAHMQSEEGQRELRQGLGDIESMLRKMMESSPGAMGVRWTRWSKPGRPISWRVSIYAWRHGPVFLAKLDVRPYRLDCAQKTPPIVVY